MEDLDALFVGGREDIELFVLLRLGPSLLEGEERRDIDEVDVRGE